ncbi:MAG TPA: glycoside hydrolase family 13 protein [Anaerolineae bacterium]|nr:glycoside hydrolase family 13 protein [Anaerolineae bacterium]
MTVPSWIYDAVFYQIFPDRFYNGNPSNDPPNRKDWDSDPTFTGYHGGDLRGIINKFDYLLDLGINAIYLNPIFLSPSPHRYNTTDYFKIDMLIGEKKDFLELVEIAHQNNVKIILDGVFNHSGRGFFAFADILENGPESPYVNWYHIKKFPLDAYTDGKAENYFAWFGFKSLPKFNISNPDVCEYIMKIIHYWLDLGADGWRLDVPNEIDDDGFWSKSRSLVKSINQEAYLVGEIWQPIPKWTKYFDGLMNYPFRDAVIGILNGEIELKQFMETLEYLTSLYPKENVFAMYLPLGSHDTKRLFTKLGGDVRRIKLAFLIQFVFPGIPAIYYGDEIGMSGGKDPENRATFRWNENEWNNDLRDWVKLLIQIRKKYEIIRRGKLSIIKFDEREKTCLFKREYKGQEVILICNFMEKKMLFEIDTAQFRWKQGEKIRNIVGNESFIIDKNKLSIELMPFTGKLFTSLRE